MREAVSLQARKNGHATEESLFNTGRREVSSVLVRVDGDGVLITVRARGGEAGA